VHRLKEKGKKMKEKGAAEYGVLLLYHTLINRTGGIKGEGKEGKILKRKNAMEKGKEKGGEQRRGRLLKRVSTNRPGLPTFLSLHLT